MKNYDVIILGGGAAGLMCAMAAGRRGRRVLVLERANKVGKKILMSGGAGAAVILRTSVASRRSLFLRTPISVSPHCAAIRNGISSRWWNSMA